MKLVPAQDIARNLLRFRVFDGPNEEVLLGTISRPLDSKLWTARGPSLELIGRACTLTSALDLISKPKHERQKTTEPREEA